MKFFYKKNPIMIFIATLGILILLSVVGLLNHVESFVINSSKPISERFYQWGTFFNRSYDDNNPEHLLLKVENLTKEIAELMVENSQQKELIVENKKLRAQLNFIENNDYQTVGAEIIARESLLDGIEAGQDLIINKGSSDGLLLGQGVVSAEGVIIGKVVEIKNTSAKVCLITSSGCKLAATIQNQDRTQGITDGDLGLTVKMNYIPQLEKIAENDTIITSGLGEKIPRGLLIGKITEVRNESNEVWQNATIEPLVNLNNLTVVGVIIL